MKPLDDVWTVTLDYVWIVTFVTLVVVLVWFLWGVFPKPTGKEVQEALTNPLDYKFPPELKGCKAFRVQSGNFGVQDLILVRCPNSTITTIQDQ